MPGLKTSRNRVGSATGAKPNRHFDSPRPRNSSRTNTSWSQAKVAWSVTTRANPTFPSRSSVSQIPLFSKIPLELGSPKPGTAVVYPLLLILLISL